MIETDNMKFVVPLVETALATNATTNSFIDTLGYEYIDVLVLVEPADATDASAILTSLVISDAPTTDVTNKTAIDGLTGTTNSTATSSQFVLPTNNTTDATMKIHCPVDLTAKERYIHVTLECPDTGHDTAAVVGILSRAKESPTTATLKGVDVVGRENV